MSHPEPLTAIMETMRQTASNIQEGDIPAALASLEYAKIITKELDAEWLIARIEISQTKLKESLNPLAVACWCRVIIKLIEIQIKTKGAEASLGFGKPPK